MIILAALLWLSPSANASGAPPDSILYVVLPAGQGGDCAPGAESAMSCRVWHPWVEADLRARWTAEGRPAWTDGDTLTLVYESGATTVRVCCTLQMPMSRFAGSDLWVLSTRVPGLAVATVEYGFLPEGARRLDAMGTLRSPAAAPRPPAPVSCGGPSGPTRSGATRSASAGP